MIKNLFPFLDWFTDYGTGKFKIDLLAGITVALVLIPQSMAYAQLAGLPAYYGLYAAFLPPMVAALFGSSRQLATGPVAVVSLMSAASLEPLATLGSPEFITYSIVLAMTVGIFQFFLGILRLGLVVNFLSHPVVNGFTNAAALIIASSQLAKFFGVQVDSAPHHYQTMINVGKAAFNYTHIPTLLFGIGALILMYTLKRVAPRIPYVLVAVAITTILSYLTGFNRDIIIPLSSIQDAKIAKEINGFNRAVNQAENLNSERKNIRLIVDDERKTLKHGATNLTLIKLQSQVSILTLDIEETKEQISTLRSSLRHYTFQRSSGQQRFFMHSKFPASEKDDGRIWRLSIGNKSLDPMHLKMMGGGAIVGTIPKGLPAFAMPELKVKLFLKLLPTAIIISLLGFMEAIAIAKAMATQTGQILNPNQELIGQGLANMCGALGSSYSVSGSFSRSAVNLQAGAVSGISSVITSIMVVITLLFFTPLLYHLPQSVLAAVIMMAVIGLVNIRGFIHAWRAQWYDGAISIFCFFITLYFAPHLDKGIMIGVALSMIVFLYKSMRPVVASLSLHEDSVLKSSEYYRLKGCQHISVIRFDGPLFFANASYLDEQVLRYRNAFPDLRYVLLDARGINDMDASGEEALEMLAKRVRSGGMGFAICGLKSQIISVMLRTGLYEKIGESQIFPDTQHAVAAIIEKIHRGTDLPEKGCSDCPLQRYMPSELQHSTKN